MAKGLKVLDAHPYPRLYRSDPPPPVSCIKPPQFTFALNRLPSNFVVLHYIINVVQPHKKFWWHHHHDVLWRHLLFSETFPIFLKFSIGGGGGGNWETNYKNELRLTIDNDCGDCQKISWLPAETCWPVLFSKLGNSRINLIENQMTLARPPMVLSTHTTDYAILRYRKTIGTKTVRKKILIQILW